MLSIERVRHEDLSETAELHHRYLHLGLFPQMGKSFLRHYQETFADSPYGIALIARNEEGVVGALFGTSANAQHYHWVMHNRGAELAAVGSLAMVVRPQLAYKFATTRLGRYVNGMRRHLLSNPDTASSAPQDPGSAAPLPVLSHIFTRDGQRRCGVGRALIEEYRLFARTRGARRAVLVTEKGGLGAPFFERIGCDCIGQRSGFDGSVVQEYRLELEEVLAHEEHYTAKGDWPGLHHPDAVAARGISAADPKRPTALH